MAERQWPQPLRAIWLIPLAVSAAPPYIDGMLRNSRFNPTGGIMDFWTQFRKPTPHRWPILLASALPCLLLLWWATEEEYRIAPGSPTIVYITSFAADQTDEEIIAGNAARQKIADQRKAEREALAARKRAIYRDLGKATGVDVPEEEEVIAAREAEEAEAADGSSTNSETADEE
jgi:hypothetical protein